MRKNQFKSAALAVAILLSPFLNVHPGLTPVHVSFAQSSSDGGGASGLGTGTRLGGADEKGKHDAGSHDGTEVLRNGGRPVDLTKPQVKASTPPSSTAIPEVGHAPKGRPETVKGTEGATEASSKLMANFAVENVDNNLSPKPAVASPHRARTPERMGSGGLLEAIDIAVPTFRGLEPNLLLQYSSSSGLGAGGLRAGWIGVGWSLEGISEIVRTAPINGTPRFNSNDIYQLDGIDMIACGTANVSPSCSTGATHATKIESYQRIKFENNVWTVWDKMGVRSIFKTVSNWGGVVESGDVEPNLIRNSYRWLLAQRVDTHGNAVDYSYVCLTLPVCYPSKISYNGTEITFISTAHPAYQTKATGRGLSKLERLLQRIEVRTNGENARAYALTHEVSQSTKLIRLKSLTEYGKGWIKGSAQNVLQGESLKPTTFTYSESDMVFLPSTLTPTPLLWREYYLLGDLNGDGRKDVVGIQQIDQERCTIRPQISTPNGFVVPAYTGLPVSEPGCAAWQNPKLNTNYGYQIADFNADGLADIFTINKTTGTAYGTGNFYITAYDANTGSLTFTKSSVTIKATLDNAYLRFLDLDGDGSVEILESDGNSIRVFKYTNGAVSITPVTSPSRIKLFSAFGAGDLNGNGRTETLDTVVTSGYYGYTVSRYEFGGGTTFESIGSYQAIPSYGELNTDMSGDFNGDGMDDIARTPTSHPIDRGLSWPVEIFNSQGNGLSRGPSVTTSKMCRAFSMPQPIDAIDYHFRPRCDVSVVDLNNDGRSDIILSSPTDQMYGSLASLEIHFPVGNDQFEKRVISLNMPNGINQFADLNGDGKIDIVLAADNQDQGANFPSGGLLLSTGPMPDLLTSVTYPSGGTVEVEYKPSSEWGLTAGTRMPFVTQTVSAITEKDGRGGVSRTEYSYRGGRYDYKERKFLGFAGLTAKLPCASGETACPSVDVTFSQAYAAIGKALKIEYRDGAGVARKTISNTYAIENTVAPYRALNTATETTLAEGGFSIVSRQESDFDAYANITQIRDFGRTDLTGDETWKLTSYAPNTTDFIVSLPRATSVRSLTNGAFSTDSDVYEQHSVFYYDGATSDATAPTKGNLTMRQSYKSVEPAASAYVEQFTYDTNGNKLSHVDGAGNRTEWDYDATYKLHMVKERAPKYFANGNLPVDTRFVTTFTPDFVCGKPANKVDWNGVTQTYTYDAFCRPYGETNSGTGAFVNTRYENEGNPQTQAVVTYEPLATGSGTVFTRSYFDGLGRTWREETSAETASGQTRITDTTYDARGNKAQTAFTRYANEAAQWTVNSYDWQNRVVKTVNPDASQRTYSYLLQSQALPNTTNLPIVDIRMTDEEGKLHRSVKDKDDNVILTAAQLSGSWVAETRSYDAKGRLRQIKDHGGATWTYNYDLIGNRLTASDPDLGNWSYSYDNANRLISQVDARGAVTTIAYDQMGRVTTKSAKGTSETAATTTVTNTYDTVATGIGAAPFHNVGLLTRAVNGAATHHYSASQIGTGTVTTTTSVIDGITHTTTETKGKPDLTLAVSYTPAALSVGTSAAPWSYNTANELTVIPGHIASATYEADGQTKTITYTNGVTTEFTYSPTRRWMTRIVTKKSTTVLMDNQYTRDKLGRIKTITGLTPSENWTYTYDDLGQLLQAANTGNSALSETYTYSPTGNLLSRTRIAGTYTYPVGTAVRPHAATSIGTKTIAYDANGNMTSDGTRTLTWDRSNLLQSVSEGASTTSFAYGADGARAIKTSPFSKTLYVNANIEIDRTTPGSEVYIRYPHPDIKISTAATNATTQSYLHRDHLQSVRLVTSQTGAIAEQTGYAAYGEATNPSMQTKKGYIGERFDAETGLMYLNARYYDPTFGRFIPKDDGTELDDDDEGSGTEAFDLQNLQMQAPQHTRSPSLH